MGAAGGIGRPVVFEETYRCYSMAMSDKPALETGDKIILPHSALDALTTMHVQYPMMFRMENPSQKRRTHVGVSEFTAVEGRCYVPHWVSSRGEGQWWAVVPSNEPQWEGVCMIVPAWSSAPLRLASLMRTRARWLAACDSEANLVARRRRS